VDSIKIIEIQELGDLVESQKYFFKKIFKNKVSILDVYYSLILHNKVIREYGEDIDYNYLEYDIFDGNNIDTNKRYDIVYSFEFCHYKFWKRYLKQATKIAKKYVLIEISTTKNHKTLDNIETCYYPSPSPFKEINKTPEKLPFIIHNLNELIEFCKNQLPISNIYLYLYNIRGSTSLFPIPQKDLLKGAMLLKIGKAEKIKTNIKIK